MAREAQQCLPLGDSGFLGCHAFALQQPLKGTQGQALCQVLPLAAPKVAFPLGPQVLGRLAPAAPNTGSCLGAQVVHMVLCQLLPWHPRCFKGPVQGESSGSVLGVHCQATSRCVLPLSWSKAARFTPLLVPHLDMGGHWPTARGHRRFRAFPHSWRGDLSRASEG